MNYSDIVIIAIIIGVIAIGYYFKNKLKKSGASCCSGCSGCSGCNKSSCSGCKR